MEFVSCKLAAKEAGLLDVSMHALSISLFSTQLSYNTLNIKYYI